MLEHFNPAALEARIYDYSTGKLAQQSVASERLKRRWFERLVERYRWQTFGPKPSPPPDLMRRRRSDVSRPTAKDLCMADTADISRRRADLSQSGYLNHITS